jgi:hypothetical protein
MTQATASKSALLLECPWSFSRDDLEREEPGEGARYGSAFHELLAGVLMGARRNAPAVAKRWGLSEEAGPELREHVTAAHDTLTTWLAGANPFRITFEGTAFVEESLALKPGEYARLIEAPDDEHHYAAAKPGEIPGTLDYALRGETLLVLDWKTGSEISYDKPLDHPQLLTLAAATMRWVGASACIVGAGHFRRRGMPKVYADRVSLADLKGYESRLAASLQRVGDGSMRPGRHCTEMYCPARDVCPARDSELLQRAGDVLTGLTAAGGALSAQGLTANDVAMVKAGPLGLSESKKLGLLYDVVRKSEALAARSRAELRQAVEAGALVETSDGVLSLREVSRESLSKTSVVEAYGKLEGARVLDKLRQDGAVRTSTVKQLHVEKERGR